MSVVYIAPISQTFISFKDSLISSKSQFHSWQISPGCVGRGGSSVKARASSLV